MSIPKQVEEAAELAEELMGNLNKDPNEEEAEEQVPEPEEAPLEPAPEEDEETQDAEADTQEEDEEDSFEQKWKSLQGKYNSEVPRLNQELKDLKASIFERLGELGEKAPEAIQETEPEVPEKVQKFLDEYGDEYADGLKAYFEHMIAPQLKESIAPVQQQVSEFEETQVKVAQGNFTNYLSEKVNGDWEKLWAGEDQGFVDFLAKPDPSGLYTYGDLVRQYNDNWDADKLAIVFNTYLGENTPPVKAAKHPTEDARIAPNRRGVDATPKSDEAKVWTQQTIKEFQASDRRGEYSTEESKRLWDDLLSAPSQNRVR